MKGLIEQISSSQPLAMSPSMHAVGIISIGEMGLGIGQLLVAHKYKVLTFAADRRYIRKDLTMFPTLLTPALTARVPRSGLARRASNYSRP